MSISTCSETVRPPTEAASYEDLQARIAELSTCNEVLSTEAAKASLILESAVDHAVITMNLGGRITRWNSGAERILGYSATEALDLSGEIFFTPEDRKAGVFIDELCRALDDGRAINERWHLRRDGSRFWASGTMVPLRDATGDVQGFLNIMRDATQSHAEVQRAALLLTEMRHRATNTFATIRAVAIHTARHSGKGDGFHEPFAARIDALARSHALSSSHVREGVSLDELIWPCLTPYVVTPEQAKASGPPVHLPAKAAISLGLAFHELATNSVKYGSLSVAEGGVDVSWKLNLSGDISAAEVEILWREYGGPAVTPPVHRGFGTQLIERGLRLELRGTLQLDFPPSGVTCLIRIPCSGAASTGSEPHFL